jgi:hypothetical protein
VNAESFEINNYVVDTTINNDGSLAVTETIDVVFSESKHGIERLLPQRYEYNETQEEIIDYNNITTNVTKSIYTEWADLILRLWDADRYVDGSQQYIISYIASPWVKQYDGRQELYRNLVGTQRWVPIRQVSFRVSTPEGIDLTQLGSGDITVVAGSNWSTGWVQVTTTKNSIIGQAQDLGINEGVTVGIKFNNGSFTSLIAPRYEPIQQYNSESNQSSDSISIPIWLIFIILSLCSSGYKRYLKKQKEKLAWPLVTQYYPPEGITPAIAGYIDNDQFDVRDFMATLYDWGARWYLTIEEQTESWIITDTTHIIYHKKQTPTNLTAYEQIIRDKMFSGSDSFDFANLNQSWLVNEEKQFFEAIVEAIKNTWETYYTSTWWIGSLFGYQQPTEEGLKIFAHLRGYRDFIEHVEQDKIEEFLKQDPLFVDKLLPWSIIFGSETKLLAQLESIASRHQPTRYVGNAFTYTSMNHIMDNSMKTLDKAYQSAYPKRSWWFGWWGWISVGGWGWWGWGRSW